MYTNSWGPPDDGEYQMGPLYALDRAHAEARRQGPSCLAAGNGGPTDNSNAPTRPTATPSAWVPWGMTALCALQEPGACILVHPQRRYRGIFTADVARRGRLR